MLNRLTALLIVRWTGFNPSKCFTWIIFINNSQRKDGYKNWAERSTLICCNKQATQQVIHQGMQVYCFVGLMQYIKYVGYSYRLKQLWDILAALAMPFSVCVEIILKEKNKLTQFLHHRLQKNISFCVLSVTVSAVPWIIHREEIDDTFLKRLARIMSVHAVWYQTLWQKLVKERCALISFNIAAGLCRCACVAW